MILKRIIPGYYYPREARGYRFQLARLSVDPSSHPSVHSCPGYISESIQLKAFKNPHTNRTHMEGVHRCVFVLYDLKW